MRENWRETLGDYQQRRIEQIETYAKKIGYHDMHSDQELIAKLVGRLDDAEWIKQKLYEARPFWVKWIDAGVTWNAYKFGGHNYYTCRLFRRIDQMIFLLKGKKAHWSDGGRLCIGNVETKTYFPGRAYVWAANMQNRHYWTRLFLNF